MTSTQVREIMHGYMGGEERPWDGVTVAVYRWSTDWAFDSDLGEVRLRNGRVISTDFLPD